MDMTCSNKLFCVIAYATNIQFFFKSISNLIPHPHPSISSFQPAKDTMGHLGISTDTTLLSSMNVLSSLLLPFLLQARKCLLCNADMLVTSQYFPSSFLLLMIKGSTPQSHMVLCLIFTFQESLYPQTKACGLSLHLVLLLSSSSPICLFQQLSSVRLNFIKEKSFNAKNIPIVGLYMCPPPLQMTT